MHIVLAVLGIIGAAYFWANRAKDAADIASKVIEVPNDIRLAARRFGFKRQTNKHPIDSLDDRNLAIAGIATAFQELASLPTQEQRQDLMLQVQSKLEVSRDDAEEMIVFGRWLITECGTTHAGIEKLAKRLYKIAGAEPIGDLLEIVKATLGDDWNDDQHHALDNVKRAFRLG